MRREMWSELAGMRENGVIIGPILLERNLYRERYLKILNDIIIPHLQDEFGDRLNRLWLAQAGVPAHRCIIVRDRLNEVFNNRVIALGRETEWPPKFIDLTPCDFFLWGYINNKVFTTPPHNLNDLRNGIITGFNELKQHRQIISKSAKAIRRAELCVERNGGHVEGHGEYYYLH